MVVLALAAALTSCRSGAGVVPTEPPTPSAHSSETGSPTPSEPSAETESPVAESPTPTPGGSPSPEAPSQPDLSEEAVTIITLEVIDGLVQASGILPDIVESDGECTLTISRDGVTRSESAPASPGPQSTYCGLVNVSAVGLEPGDWDAVLSYRSSTTAGESAPTKVQVP